MEDAEPAVEAALRAEARAWLEASFPAWRASAGDPQRYTREHARSWHLRLYEGGWAAPLWPKEFGGRGFGPVESAIWAEEKARVGATIPFDVVGLGMAGPTIIAHGTADQKERWLAPLLRGEELWCQLFSEPGAGSDLAALTTRAVREGDDWIVTGQKVWSSGAHEADWGILLARYDVTVPKHEGLVYLVVDMRSPGVEVRPLRQINGEAHFNEVFLSEVRIPDGNRIGEPGDGWRVARTTLMHERMSIGSASAGYTFPFARLAEIARSRGGADSLGREDLVRIYAKERLLQMLNARVISKLRRGQIPTAEGSILKLAIADLASDAAGVGMRLLGGDALVAGEEGPQQAFLWAPGIHIGGGTDEVQRNLIAERVLGLPREPPPGR